MSARWFLGQGVDFKKAQHKILSRKQDYRDIDGLCIELGKVIIKSQNCNTGGKRQGDSWKELDSR